MMSEITHIYNLPLQPTPFVGREPEIAEIVGLLQNEDCRLLSLVGPGGIGKTRLAVESIPRLSSDDFEHGVFYVPLAPLTSADNIVPTVIGVLGIMIGDEGTPQEELIKFLSGRNLLLVMDNFEHVLEGVDLVADILNHAHDVKILVTSRESLNLQVEWVWHVRGMRYPEDTTIDEIEHYSALKLFLDRAGRIRRDFSPDTQLDCAIRICQLVGGMPLAIELAASWLKLLSCQNIIKEIERGIDFLSTRARDIPERHRSIRAVFDHSWNLLSPDEQAVFPRLSVFRGGFTREAAEAVTGADLATLSGLVEKSMVRRDASGRYDVHELLRQYAEEKLESSDEAESVALSHMLFYARFMRDRESDLKSHLMLEGVSQIEADFENVRQAWDKAIAVKHHDAIFMMIETLWQYQFIRYFDLESLFIPAYRTFMPLSDEVPHPVWGRILSRSFAIIDDPILMLNKALEFARMFEDKMEIAYCIQTLGVMYLHDAAGTPNSWRRTYNDISKAIIFYEESLQIFTEIENNFGVADVLNMLGICYDIQGDADTAFRYYLSGLKMSRAIDNKIRIVRVLCALTISSLNRGRYQEAEQYAQEAIAITYEMSDRWGASSFFVLGHLSMLRGQFGILRSWIQKAGSWALEHNDTGVNNTTLRLQSWLAGLEGSYLESRQLFNQSLALSDSLFLNNVHILSNDTYSFDLMLIVSVLQDEYDVKHHCVNIIKSAIERKLTGAMLWILPPVAVVLARDDHKEWGIELLGLAYNHPVSLTGWIDKWVFLNQLRADLEAELGTEAYQDVWERGANRDLDTTISELITYFGDDDPDTTVPIAQPLAEPLTDRELEVLELVAQGLTNPQIAEKLYLSTGTVKVHTRNIYGKLNVSNRTEAATTARQLKLIS